MAGPFKPVGVDADNLFPARVETRLTETIRDTIGSTLVAGANTTITVNDAGNTVTIASTGTGGGSTPPAASTSAAGVVELADLAETQAGTNPALVPTVVTMRQTVQGYHLDDFSAPASHLDLDNFKLMNVAPGTLASDAATVGQLNLAGTTAQRPAGATTGVRYYDTTLHKPIWRDGTDWRDATGAIV